MARNSFKIVFLIDQYLKNYDGNSFHSTDALINIVRVCVLKILAYFASHQDATSSPGKIDDVRHNRVEWDVTYFRGKSRTFRDKPRFREFTLKHFESFETELETRFQVLKTAIADRRLQSESLHGLEDVESDVLNALKHALRSVIHDYSWDRPDIMSPVKLSRYKSAQLDQKRFRKTCTFESVDMKQNFAFIIAECPRDAEDLDISVLNSSAVLRSLLPNDFRQQFADDLGIRLFWIDTGTDEQLVSCSLEHIFDFVQLLFICHCL